jgi:hypothetical protein
MKRAPDYQNPFALKQPCNASLLKLVRHVEEDLTSNQGVVGLMMPSISIGEYIVGSSILPPGGVVFLIGTSACIDIRPPLRNPNGSI